MRSTILALHQEPASRPRLSPRPYVWRASLLCLLCALCAGCIFSPKKDDSGGGVVEPPPDYPKRDTPKNAILYLTLAWENRDSVRIDSVYADNYVGTSSDLTDPNDVPLTFAKSDEVRLVSNMAKSQSIVKVDMDFGLQAGWSEGNYVSDPPDWYYVLIPSFTIYVNDSVEGEKQATSPAPKTIWRFEFTVRPDPDLSSPADTVWQVVRWVEDRAKL